MKGAKTKSAKRPVASKKPGKAKAMMALKTPTKPQPASPPSVTPALPTLPSGSSSGEAQAAYAQFLAAAEALPAMAVLAFRGDANLVYANVQTGVTNVIAQKNQILAELPHEDLTVFTTLPAIALGLIFATIRAHPTSKRDTALQDNLAEARALRAVLLSSAEALAIAGVLAGAAVAKIKGGKGSLDTAHDLIDLAALYQSNAEAVAGKTAVTAAQISRASELGSGSWGRSGPRARRGRLTRWPRPRATCATASGRCCSRATTGSGASGRCSSARRG